MYTLPKTEKGNYENEHVELIFNRDIQINETETISNIQNSKGIISDKTLIANHPWVTDIESELEQIEKRESLMSLPCLRSPGRRVMNDA